MSEMIPAVRGMNDILPDHLRHWRRLESAAAEVLAAYGYREIRLPLVERTELFARSIGEHTDIVEKEMYSFTDRNGDRLTLRPEGTAGCVRAAAQNGLLRGHLLRLWYAGPMFRHERPQRGRYRQFHQVGVEAFGVAGPDIDAELILMGARLWRALGLEGLALEINSLGTPGSRRAYREALVAYLADRRAALDPDSQRRLERNPLRILDSKDPGTREVVAGAPRLWDFLDPESRAHFRELEALLDAAGLPYRVNPYLVRGLDYYTRTVFEWVTAELGAQGTVCAGGRFDGLVRQLGGPDTPAAGFALGMERLVELMALQGVTAPDDPPAVFLAAAGVDGGEALRLGEELRDAGVSCAANCGGGSFKAQMKRADRSGARLAVILGADELAAGEVSVKDLRGGGGQRRLPRRGLAARVAGWLAGEVPSP